MNRKNVTGKVRGDGNGKEEQKRERLLPRLRMFRVLIAAVSFLRLLCILIMFGVRRISRYRSLFRIHEGFRFSLKKLPNAKSDAPTVMPSSIQTSISDPVDELMPEIFAGLKNRLAAEVEMDKYDMQAARVSMSRLSI